MSGFEFLLTPGKIGKLEVPNRIVMPPMGTHSSDNGFITDRTINYYVERAKGGVGLILGQVSNITSRAQIPRRSNTWDDKFIPGLKKLADAVHEAGATVGWQINYYGKLYSQWLHEMPDPEHVLIIGPSAIPWVRTGSVPKEATQEDIEFLVEAFGEAARRVKSAGFDIVEIHGAHGYGISQWLSPRDNRRTDEYGGSPERRARFACEIIRRVKEKVGSDFPVSFRFSGAHFSEGGSTLEDSRKQAPLFVEAGADALHISACDDESTQWQFLTHLFPDGAIVYLAEAIKKVVNVPVITVGKIWDPLHAERILKEGKADFVAMGRALLADPEIPKKAKEGRLDEIRRCIYCNNCFHREPRAAHIKAIGRSCTVNPALLRENEFIIKPTASAKRIMVVGGGLAGMEAARILAERGHQVSLYERTDKLGGQWNIASQQPLKELFTSVTQRMVKGLYQEGVDVKLNSEVTLELVKKQKPEIVLLATGANPRSLDVPGTDGPNVIQANDVITGKAQVGNRVVVIGGRLVGMELADHLAQQGKKVSLVTKEGLGQDGSPLDKSLVRELRNRLIEHGVYLYPDSPVVEIRATGVHIAFKRDSVRDLVFLKADTVVLAVGAKPERTLAEGLKGSGFTVYEIGDCLKPRDAMEAIREGAELGRQI